MPADNLDRVREVNAAFNEGRISDWTGWFAEDVVFEDRNHGPDQPPVVRGLPALVTAAQGWQEALRDFRADLGDISAVGDAVLAEVTWRGTGEGSGVPLELPMVDISWWEGEKIVRYVSGLQSLDEARGLVAEDRRTEAG